jgi:hypothetical protein
MAKPINQAPRQNEPSPYRFVAMPLSPTANEIDKPVVVCATALVCARALGTERRFGCLLCAAPGRSADAGRTDQAE